MVPLHFLKTGDTFLDMSKWGKGIVFVNGHNLGRYWNIGPQQTLYLPGCWLKKGKNTIAVFEQINDVKQKRIAITKTISRVVTFLFRKSWYLSYNKIYLLPVLICINELFFHCKIH